MGKDTVERVRESTGTNTPVGERRLFERPAVSPIPCQSPIRTRREKRSGSARPSSASSPPERAQAGRSTRPSLRPAVARERGAGGFLRQPIMVGRCHAARDLRTRHAICSLPIMRVRTALARGTSCRPYSAHSKKGPGASRASFLRRWVEGLSSPSRPSRRPASPELRAPSSVVRRPWPRW